MLNIIKLDCRITHSKLNEDILENIEACMLDLKRVGVHVPDQTTSYDALLVKAIKLYCRAEYNYNGEAERYKKAYEKLRDALSLCGDYNEPNN